MARQVSMYPSMMVREIDNGIRVETPGVNDFQTLIMGLTLQMYLEQTQQVIVT